MLPPCNFPGLRSETGTKIVIRHAFLLIWPALDSSSRTQQHDVKNESSMFMHSDLIWRQIPPLALGMHGKHRIIYARLTLIRMRLRIPVRLKNVPHTGLIQHTGTKDKTTSTK